MSRYKAYPEYRDSGLQWLGEMPSHWVLRKSKYVFNRVQREVRLEDGVVTAFRDGQVTLRSNRRTEGFTESIKEIGYQGVRKGDLLVHAMDGFAGAIGVSDSDGKCSPVCSVCVPTDPEQIHVAYFGYLVRQLAVTDFISSLAKGIRERSTEFRYSEFSVLDLAFPPQNEQANIAAFLDHETAKIDALIEKQQRLIELLKEKRQAVISHAVTKGLNPNAPMKDSGVEWLGEVPAHWIVLQLRRVLTGMEQGKSPECESRPADLNEWGVLKTGCVNNGAFNFNENKFLPEHIAPFSQFEVKNGDVLMSRASGSVDLIGSVAYVNNPREKLLLSDKIFRLRFEPSVHKIFFTRLMQSSYMRSKIKVEISGAEGMANNITKSSINSFRFALPPFEEQVSIAQAIEKKVLALDRLIQRSVFGIDLLQERRTALISAAVTGKIDVRDWQAVAVQEGVGVEC